MGVVSEEVTRLVATLPKPIEQTPTELQAAQNRAREDASRQ